MQHRRPSNTKKRREKTLWFKMFSGLNLIKFTFSNKIEMAKIFKKYKQWNFLKNLQNFYTEASLLEETEVVRAELLNGPDKCAPESEEVQKHMEKIKEIEEESFYYNRTTPSYERCSSSPFTDPEDCQKSISPISTESCSSEYYHSPKLDDILKQSKDQRVASLEGIDKFITVDQIINMELKELKDELMRQMAVNGMNQEQYDSSMCIRKRGKNKSAAQNCRRKKQYEIATLGVKVTEKNKEKEENMMIKEKMERIRDEWSNNLDRLYAQVLEQQNLDPNTFKVCVEGDEVRFQRKEPPLPPLLNIARISHYKHERGLLF